MLLTRDLPMQALNARWMGSERPTDVLSFPAWEPDELPPEGAPTFLGDIALNMDAVLRQAPLQAPARWRRLGLAPSGAWGPRAEATFLLIHGVLHLIGHDHATPEQEEAMASAERELMDPFLRPPWRR